VDTWADYESIIGPATPDSEDLGPAVE
jgi:hypothetical protein